MYGAETYNETSYDHADSGGNEFMIGLLCGTAVGAAIGLLLAPKTGAELRTQLADSAGRIRRKAGETYDQASGTISKMVDKGRGAMDEAVEKGRDAMRQGREKFDEARSDAKAEFNKATGTTY